MHTDKLDSLVRSVALALRTATDSEVFLQAEEDNLLTFLVSHQHVQKVQQLLYQVLYCEIVTNTPRYEAFVQRMLGKIQDVGTAGLFIKVLPRLTDDVWRYLRDHSEQIDQLFEILKFLILTSEEGQKGLNEVFSIVEHTNSDLQKKAISLVSEQLYFICPDVIENRVVTDFKALWYLSHSGEAMNSGNVEPKVRLFFKLIHKNPTLLSHLYTQYPTIQNPAAKKIILNHYSRALRKDRISLKHELLVKLVKTAPINSQLLIDTLAVVKDLDSFENSLKEVSVTRMLSEHIVSWIPLLGPRLNLVVTKQKEVELMLPLILRQSPAAQEPMLQTLLESPYIDPSSLLVLLVRGKETECIPALKILIEMTRVYTSSVLQAAINSIIELTPLPILSMYIILKALDEFPELKEFLMTEALPGLLNREVWENGRIWKGVIKFIKTTTPDSIVLLDRLPLSVRRELERMEEVKKGMVEYQLRQKKGLIR